MKKQNKIRVISGFCVLTILANTAGAKLIEVKKIPNGRKYSCDNCHLPGTNDKDKLTPFGIDYRANDKKWDAVLAAKDSDKDGMTNGQELGDPEGTWKKGDKDPSGPVFNPGDPSSHK